MYGVADPGIVRVIAALFANSGAEKSRVIAGHEIVTLGDVVLATPTEEPPHP